MIYEQQLREMREFFKDMPFMAFSDELKQFAGTKYADALKLTERYIYKEKFVPVGEEIPEEVFMLNFMLNEQLLLAKEFGLLKKLLFASTSEKQKINNFLIERSAERTEQAKFELSTETATEQDAKLRFLIRARRLYLPKSFPANHRGLKFPRGKSGVSQKSPTSDIKYTTSDNNYDSNELDKQILKDIASWTLFFIIFVIVVAILAQ